MLSLLVERGMNMKPIVLALWKKYLWIFNYKHAYKYYVNFLRLRNNTNQVFFPFL